jgi:hypothetical protein
MIDAGIKQLESVILRIGVEAYEAEVRGLSYAEAATDLANFPWLHKVHVGVRDLLTVMLDPEAANHVERMLSMPSPPVAEKILLALGRMAGGAVTVQSAAARFGLLQALRLNLIVAEMLGDSTIAEDGGLPKDIDAACEEEVRWWIREGAKHAADVQPLRILVVSALDNLRGRLEEVRMIVARLGDEAREECQRRQTIELMLREMDAADGLLLRNEEEIAEELGEQRLDVQRLIDTHPLAFPDAKRDSIYVHAQRVRERVLHDEILERRRPALIDLIRNRLKQGA